jgi:uncharacterized delta-60 repeat protein
MANKIWLRGFITFLASVGLIIIVSVRAGAAPGDLDSTFGVGGKVVTQTGFDDKVKAIAVQTDGKIVVAGRRETTQDGLLARYQADGSLDADFGVGGFVTDAAHGGHSTYFNAVAIQVDGKIVAAGYFIESGGCTGARAWVVRYNTDGTRDTTFGGGDGEIEFFIYCSPDGTSSYTHLNGLAIQSNGKIVIAGSSKNASGNFDFAAVRLNSNGSFDTTFNTDGLATFPIGSGSDEAYAVAVNPTSGKIALAGYGNSTTFNDFALVVLTSGGLLDLTFAHTGKVMTNTGGDDAANAVTFQADGKIIAAGRQSNGSNGTDFSLARFNTNGSLDASFGVGGKTVTAFSGYTDASFGIALQTNGKAIAAGYGADNNNLGTSYNFSLARYNTNGLLDTTFSGDGKQMTDFNVNADIASAVVIQADGKIVVAGYASNGGDYDIALARYLP